MFDVFMPFKIFLFMLTMPAPVWLLLALSATTAVAIFWVTTRGNK